MTTMKMIQEEEEEEEERKKERNVIRATFSK
jgi:hypothetical protein